MAKINLDKIIAQAISVGYTEKDINNMSLSKLIKLSKTFESKVEEKTQSLIGSELKSETNEYKDINDSYITDNIYDQDWHDEDNLSLDFDDEGEDESYLDDIGHGSEKKYNLNVDDIEKHFNLKNHTIRPQQREILEQIVKNIDNVRSFIIDAPTGTGKSAIAKTIGDMLGKTLILTSTKLLQDQYEHDFASENFISIKGKTNYKCQRNSKNSCVECCWNFKNKIYNEEAVKCSKNCPYDTLVKKLKNKNVSAVTNYAFGIRYLQVDSDTQPKFDCVILDEGHTTIDQLLNAYSIDLNINDLEEAGVFNNKKINKNYIKYLKSMPKNMKNINDISNRVEIIAQLFKGINLYLKDYKYNDDLSKEENESKQKDHDKLRKARTFLRPIKDFLNKVKIEDRYISCEKDTKVKDNYIIHIKPKNLKDVTYFFKRDMARRTNKIIVMSSSIINHDLFAERLGFDEGNWLSIFGHEVFDPNKSPITFIDCGCLTYSTLSKQMPVIFKRIRDILDFHKGEKGIVHVPSYKMLKDIVEEFDDINWTYKKNAKDTNTTLIEEHAEKKQSVLISPSMKEGVDLIGNLSTFQIIVKLAWPNLGDPYTVERKKFQPEWYVESTLNNLVQACGRSTRTYEDSAVTYILDIGAWRIIEDYWTKLPEAFTNRIKSPNQENKLQQQKYKRGS